MIATRALAPDLFAWVAKEHEIRALELTRKAQGWTTSRKIDFERRDRYQAAGLTRAQARNLLAEYSAGMIELAAA